MSAPSALALVCALTGAVPIGTGKYATNSTLSHVPAGAGSGTPIVIGSAAGQVNGAYSPAAALSIANNATPTSIVLSTLTQPDGSNCSFAHVSHVLIENLDTANSITFKSGATHGVTWLSASGVALPASMAGQSSYCLLAVPAGLAISAGVADQIDVSCSGGAAVQFQVTILGRNT